MEKHDLARRLRALAQQTDLLLQKETVAHADVAPVQGALAELQALPLEGPGVDLVIATSVRRLHLRLAAADFAPTTAIADGDLSLLRLFLRPPSPEEAARRQQSRARKALAAFRKELGDILFALVM